MGPQAGLDGCNGTCIDGKAGAPAGAEIPTHVATAGVAQNSLNDPETYLQLQRNHKMSLSMAISTNWVREIRRKTFGMPPSEEKVRNVLSHERPSKNSSTGKQAKPPLINIAAFDWMSNQPQVLRQIIQIYLEITPGTVEQINEGIAGGDSEQVAQAAHSLKGSSAELGAEQLANLCHQLYMQAKAENKDSAERLAAEVSRCYRETSTALNALDLG